MGKRRVVVTGLGVISSIGSGIDEFWENLVAGKSGISEISTFHAPNYPSQKGGEIKDFTPRGTMPRDIGRASQFALEAAKEALDAAGLASLSTRQNLQQNRIGVVFGTTNGEAAYLEEIDRIWLNMGESEVWPATIVKYPLYAIAENVARYFKIKGLSYMIPTACSAGNYSVGYGYDLIKNDRMDVVVTGGADPLTRYAFAGFGRLFAMAPEKCQPFDKNRKGMMVGEGAGVLVLEEYERAKKRNTRIYAEVLGYGLGCDAYNMTAPNEAGIAKVMEKAIKNSAVRKEDIDYVCAHGTGTPANDKEECRAVKRVFGKSASKVSMSSIKSMLGHTMGAASAIEAVSCVLSLVNNVIPPTINNEIPDPECEGIDCVFNTAREKELNVVLNNSLAFGGNNACVAFKKIGRHKSAALRLERVL